MTCKPQKHDMQVSNHAQVKQQMLKVSPKQAGTIHLDYLPKEALFTISRNGFPVVLTSFGKIYDGSPNLLTRTFLPRSQQTFLPSFGSIIPFLPRIRSSHLIPSIWQRFSLEMFGMICEQIYDFIYRLPRPITRRHLTRSL